MGTMGAVAISVAPQMTCGSRLNSSWSMCRFTIFFKGRGVMTVTFKRTVDDQGVSQLYQAEKKTSVRCKKVALDCTFEDYMRVE